MGRILFAVLLALGLASPARAQIDSIPKVHARLISEHPDIAPGATVTVALELDIRPGWHIYWHNPGDAGAPTEIKWSLPPGWHSGPIEWPYPKDLPVGPLMDYGYDGKVWLLTEITAPANAASGVAKLDAAIDWLVCREVCIPEDTTLSLTLPISTAPSPPYSTIAEQFAAARARLPVTALWSARFALRDGLRLFLGAPGDVRSAAFFPDEQDVIKGIAPQQLAHLSSGVVLRLEPGKHAKSARSLSGVVELTEPDGSVRGYTINAGPGAVPTATFTQPFDMTLPLALLFAFIGGLILNLMPCVLPILAMKALSVASHAGRPGGEASREGLSYGAGAVLSFAGLGALVNALRAGGAAVGWGFQLQEPLVVALFALVIFAVALNLSGVFEVPGVGAGESLTRRGGMIGAFFTGVLAVAVAAPCTAPFMAAALGFALTQTDGISLGIFVALGIGFAAPFVLLSMWPALLRLLPKPGTWMIVFRQLLAFPMYGTALWLAWVFSVQSANGALVMLLMSALALAFALWAMGTSQQSTGGGRLLGWVPLVAFLAASPFAAAHLQSAGQAAPVNLSALPSEPFTQARLDAYRAQHRAVFVNATAAWCVTCMVNDKVAIDDSRVRAAFAAHRVAYLVADWTRRNAAVTAILNAYGRSGVPLYIYYAPGATEAKILPQILTPDEILGTIDGR